MLRSLGWLGGAAALAAGISAGAAPAWADSVTATLSATYYEVVNGTDPDFGTGGTPNVAAGSALGPNGLPVVESGSPGINDVGPGNQITWWSPALNSNVSETGTGTIALPYSSNMYAPNSTGSNDSAVFETAVFSGTFTLTTAGTVEFSLGSDDDSFIYVDGVLIGQNPGIHAVTDVNFSSSPLAAGNHSIEVFYADRDQTGANLSLSLVSSGITITPGVAVPEPASLALLLPGLMGLGLLRRRGRAA